MQVVSVPSAPTASRAARPAEATELHSRILRLALGVEESRSYWEHVDFTVPPAERALVAFEQRWFGAKSLERVRYLIACFVSRYDSFPEALVVLRRWQGMDAATRQAVCHFHLQLSDPLYRRFTGSLLVERRGVRDANVSRNLVLRWLKSEYPDRWSDATYVQFASKLLSAASEAGLLSPKRDPRSLLVPKVSDEALAYLLYLLRAVRFEGSLTENPYLASVGLTDGFLDQRLRGLRGVTYRRMAHLVEFDWDFASLSAWAEEHL